MKVAILTMALMLSACTIQIEDKRLTREEVAVAFKQRDDALTTIIEKLKQLETNQQEKKKDVSKP